MTKNSNLVEITTPRQAKNGTRMFYDTASKCCYGSYASGYVRRSFLVRFSNTIGPARLNSTWCMYPMNPRATISSDSLYKSTTCLMISDESDRIALINKAADRGWTYKGSYDKSLIGGY